MESSAISEDMVTAVIPVSAYEKIKQRSDILRRQWELDGLQSLSKKNWALQSILNRAIKAIKNGELEVNITEHRAYLIDNLRDEGVEVWQRAYDEAFQEALRDYFTPHPDSL